MYQEHLKILRLMLEATRQGKFVWRNLEPDTYYANVEGSFRWYIRYKYPMLSNDDGSDMDIAEVSAGGTRMTFYAGTEGRYLVDEIIGLTDPKFIEHRKKILGFIKETVKRLESL
ncbi:MAG TPA: hypothetical protein VFD48_13780 [Pyrinomonadaceae bacterium]|nr:hypothetical protein [Pyrinomonadaceae bacterium]